VEVQDARRLVQILLRAGEQVIGGLGLLGVGPENDNV
jgi:hypothetical protein